MRLPLYIRAAAPAVVLAVVAGCALRAESPPAPARAAPVEGAPAPQGDDFIVDHLGRDVAIGPPPQRIVSLSPGNTELLFALGLDDRIVGVTSYGRVPDGAGPKEVVGGFSTASLEKIVALRPDLVFATQGNPAELLQGLGDHGINYAAFQPESLDDLVETTRLIARLTHTEAAAAALIQSWEQTTSALRDALADLPEAERPRSLFVISLDGLWVAGPRSHLHDMIELAGGSNVAGDAPTASPQYSFEEIVARDPEALFLTADHTDPAAAAADALEGLEREPRWARVTAVREGRVFVLDADDTLRPGPRLFDVLPQMARCLHPDRFTSP